MTTLLRFLARRRVPIGSLPARCAVARAAHPAITNDRDDDRSIGEGIRIWAAGQLEKGREVTSVGSVRLTRHHFILVARR